MLKVYLTVLYDSWEDFYRSNCAEPGLNSLVRAKLNQYCIGHGNGTYDYFLGDFS